MMKPIHRIERLTNLSVLEVFSAPYDQRESALASIRARCYSAAITAGVSHRSAMNWARKTEHATRALVEIIELRL
jgi:hypothetical protein